METASRTEPHLLVADLRRIFGDRLDAVVAYGGRPSHWSRTLALVGSLTMDDLTALTQTYFNANSDRLNAVATRLTIGGTLFVIYTVVTGFFGQNFGWLVDNIDSKYDFLLYGVGALVVPTVVLLTLFWVKRDDWF